MRMKKIIKNRTLKSAAAEFLAFKRAQKIRERTLHDYQKYINPFVEQSSNSMGIDVLKREILEYFTNIPATSPARYNHPYDAPFIMYGKVLILLPDPPVWGIILFQTRLRHRERTWTAEKIDHAKLSSYKTKGATKWVHLLHGIWSCWFAVR